MLSLKTEVFVLTDYKGIPLQQKGKFIVNTKLKLIKDSLMTMVNRVSAYSE